MRGPPADMSLSASVPLESGDPDARLTRLTEEPGGRILLWAGRVGVGVGAQGGALTQKQRRQVQCVTGPR